MPEFHSGGHSVQVRLLYLCPPTNHIKASEILEYYKIEPNCNKTQLILISFPSILLNPYIQKTYLQHKIDQCEKRAVGVKVVCQILSLLLCFSFVSDHCFLLLTNCSVVHNKLFSCMFSDSYNSFKGKVFSFMRIIILRCFLLSPVCTGRDVHHFFSFFFLLFFFP